MTTGRLLWRFALGITWLASVGRYWDHPSAQAWHDEGLGAVACGIVLALSAFNLRG